MCTPTASVASVEEREYKLAHVISKSGTPIAYDQTGNGPAVILVEGALGYRSFGFSPHLAELLAPHLTAISYDRRGRGESSDTQPYSVAREIEDIDALIDAADLPPLSNSTMEQIHAIYDRHIRAQVHPLW